MSTKGITGWLDKELFLNYLVTNLGVGVDQNDINHLVAKYGGKNFKSVGLMDYNTFLKDVLDDAGGGATNWAPYPGLKEAIKDCVRFCN